MAHADNIELKRISYAELKNQIYDFNGDDFGIVSDYLNKQTREALLSNPNFADPFTSVLNIIYYNGQVVGRHLLMPTKVHLGDCIVPAQTGGGHEVVESFRGKGLGTKLVRDSIFNSEFPFYIGQLYSTQAISILRKLGLTVFEVPLYYKLLNFRPILEAKGISGVLLSVFSAIGNLGLKILNMSNTIRLHKLKKKYTIKKEGMIPSWVDEIVLKDGHEFTEYHDHKWFQWNVDCKFTSKELDKQEFFAVYDHFGKPQGFFVIKVRFEAEQGIYRKITRGTIVEWGSFDEELLSEIDLNLMALGVLNHHVDTVLTVVSDPKNEVGMKHLGYLRHGEFQMVIKPDSLQDNRICEQKNWRIRYGGCNTIVF